MRGPLGGGGPACLMDGRGRVAGEAGGRGRKSLAVLGCSRSLTLMAANDRSQLDHHPERPHATPLDAASVEAVARRVVELIRSEDGSSIARGLVDAATLAAELGVERSWVYAHRDELGAIQLGSGSKPRLRFDVEVAREVLARSPGASESHEAEMPLAAGSPGGRRHGRVGSDLPLLPIKGAARSLNAGRGRR
jgi:hypothetical protein